VDKEEKGKKGMKEDKGNN